MPAVFALVHLEASSCLHQEGLIPPTPAPTSLHANCGHSEWVGVLSEVGRWSELV